MPAKDLWSFLICLIKCRRSSRSELAINGDGKKLIILSDSRILVPAKTTDEVEDLKLEQPWV